MPQIKVNSRHPVMLVVRPQEENDVIARSLRCVGITGGPSKVYQTLHAANSSYRQGKGHAPAIEDGNVVTAVDDEIVVKILRVYCFRGHRLPSQEK